ncbi:STAS domain-containing protein [Nonomuraea salmonea]|jgi:anti-anti-sigma regulatory factor|uniref:STAS domain-containing protein n=1 Tax=Nonomuraea salmonea TaxID=46181 RepID=A0ABV5NZS9_9ACTN
MHPSEPGIHESDPDFDIRLDRHGQVVLLSLTGRLEGVACLVLQQYLVNALVARIPPLLAVDLRSLAAIDEHGRDILRSAARHARVAEGRMIVVYGEYAAQASDDDGGEIEAAGTVEDALTDLSGTPRWPSG